MALIGCRYKLQVQAIGCPFESFIGTIWPVYLSANSPTASGLAVLEKIIALMILRPLKGAPVLMAAPMFEIGATARRRVLAARSKLVTQLMRRAAESFRTLLLGTVVWDVVQLPLQGDPVHGAPRQ